METGQFDENSENWQLINEKSKYVMKQKNGVQINNNNTHINKNIEISLEELN